MPPAPVTPIKHRKPSTGNTYWKDRFGGDPVAGKTSWEPLGVKASKFLTHRLVRIHDRHWELRATPIAYLVCLALFILALLFLTHELRDAARTGWYMTGIFAIIQTGGLALRYRKRLKRIVFDKGLGSFQGSHGSGEEEKDSPLEKYTSLDRIHALQVLINKPFYGTGLTCHELNLILGDGSRIKLIDHTKQELIRRYAADLGDFLGKPVWDTERAS